jgi:hypothetical protein
MLKNPVFAAISLAAFILLFNLTQSSFSQESLNVEKGKKYKFVLFDETEIIGRVIEADSSIIKVQQETKTVFIRADNVLYISTDLTPTKYKSSFSLLGGVSLSADDRSYSYYSQNQGINFNLMGMFYISETKAVKIDMGYSYFKPGTSAIQLLYYPYYPVEYSGGEVSHFTFKPNIVLGTMNPANRFMAYGSLGLGINFTHQNERTERQYSDYDSTYHTYITPKRNYTNAVISLGGGMGYRFTKNLGIHAEIEYNLVTAGEYFFIFGGRSYFPMRAGITYYLF